MGLNKSSYQDNGNITYLTVGTGKNKKGEPQAILSMRCQADHPEAVQVFKKDNEPALTKDGDFVYRREFASLDGQIAHMERHDADFGGGKKASYLNITIVSGDEVFVLQLDRGGQYWGDFLLRLPMYDPTKETRFQPYLIQGDDGKFQRGIAIKQDGQKVKRRWNREDGYDGGPPQGVYDEDEKEWDFRERNKWLEKNVMQPIAEEIAALNLMPKRSAQQPATREDYNKGAAALQTTRGFNDMPPIGGDDDDLPF